MCQTNSAKASPNPDFLQSEPIKFLMQNRNYNSLNEMADKIDEAMLWVVFNSEFVSSQEKAFADIYAELRDARNYFRLLSKYLQDLESK